MVLLFIFTAIVSCITTRLFVHFFKNGMSVFELAFTIALLALCILLLGYMRGDFNIAILDSLIK